MLQYYPLRNIDLQISLNQSDCCAIYVLICHLSTKDMQATTLINDRESYRQILRNTLNYNTQLMSDNFRVVECLSTPSELFCLYDYTKIAYLVEDYICIREVVTDEAMPTFIKLQSSTLPHRHFQRYIGFVSYPNCLVLAERSPNRDISMKFYTHNQLHIKIPSEIGRRTDSDSELKMEIHQSQRYIYLIVKRQTDVEILVVDFEHRVFAGRGFLSGIMEQFRVKQIEGTETFSFFSRDTQQIVEYEVIALLKQDHSVRIAEKNHLQIAWKEIMYCWVGEELVLVTRDSIHILIEGKQAQTIENFHNVNMVTNMLSGFMVLNNLYLRIYKKNSCLYELKLQFSLPCHPSSHLQLSPQQDMLAFYCDKTKAICYSCEFSQSGQQEGVSRKLNEQLPLYYINHYKENQIKTYSSQLPLFVISTASILSIYSPVTFKCFLSMRANVRELSLAKKKLMRSTSLVSDKMLNEIGEGQMIETVGIHPMQQMVAVAFRSTVRVYFVLYNEFKVVKDIKMTHCKQIGFNHSGSIMYCKVGGKQGNKIYLYSVLRHFQCIEVLTASKPVEMMLWTPLDNQVFGFYQNGYYYWSVENSFKTRHQSASALSFSIRGAAVYHNSIIIWGQNQILQLQNHSILQGIRVDKKITNFIVQSNSFIITTEHGELYRCKGFSNITNTLNSHQNFKLGAETRIFSVGSGTVLCLNDQGNILCIQWGGEEKSGLEVVGIQRRRIEKYQSEYAKYDQKIKDLQEKMAHQIEMLKEEFHKRQNEQRSRFIMEIQDREQRYLQVRAQRLKTEHLLDENMRTHEQETLQHVKELERMYERKIAVTTNKLLTSEEIAFRNQLLAKQNLYLLQQKHSEDIICVREEYSKNLQKQLSQGDHRQELYQIKKQYETKLSELEQENENLLKRFQSVTEGSIMNLKKNVVNLEVKYGEAVSQKYNLLKQFQEERIQLDVMRTRNSTLEAKLEEETRRAQQLTREYSRIEQLVIEKDNTIVCLQKRIQQLEKSNEIFKYRIIEMKNISDPKEEEILKLKDNMIELEQEYEKISKKAHEHEQTVSLLKKDISQLRQTLGSTQARERKLDKDYGMVMDKLREATKAPIQEIRKMLMRILEIFQNAADSKAHQEQKRPGSPLGELNRVREHLEVCLIEAVEIGKKNDKQSNIQISRKNRQNSQLLKEINDLRVRARDLETRLKERETQLQQIQRESRQLTSSVKKDRREDRPSTHYETEMQQPGRYKTRESFFQKSLFKGHWKQKRLKTQQGTRSKKSTHSFVKQQGNHLYIQTKGQEVQELRRLLEQKQTIIKQLINKIHKLS